MKIFTKMAAVVLACVLAVPGEARVNVVYQRQDRGCCNRQGR